jgi:hypothetical protein
MPHANQPPSNFYFASGHADFIRRDITERRFAVVGATHPAAPHSQKLAENARAHHAFIEAQQRSSGVRARLCSTGCYSLYNAHGQFIGRTVTGDGGGFCKSTLRTMAVRMAYADDLASACRMVDQDYEATGTVTPVTVALLRKLLNTISGA